MQMPNKSKPKNSFGSQSKFINNSYRIFDLIFLKRVISKNVVMSVKTDCQFVSKEGLLNHRFGGVYGRYAT